MATAHNSPSSRCAVCGEGVDGGLLQCPKCGCGTFVSSDRLATNSGEAASRGAAVPDGIELLDAGEITQVPLQGLDPEVARPIKEGVAEGETPLLLVKYCSDYWVVTQSHLVDLRKKRRVRYELAKMSLVGLAPRTSPSRADLTFTYEGAEVRVPGDLNGPVLLGWLRQHGVASRHDSSIDVDIFDGGKVKQVPLDSLNPKVVALVKEALTEGERPLLLVENWGRYWVVTHSHLIDLRRKTPARYELAKMVGLGVDESGIQQLTFTYEGAEVLVPGRGRPVIDWLGQHGIRPRYESIEWVGKEHQDRRPWTDLSPSWRYAIEEALGPGERPLVAISPGGGLGWVCTDSELVDLAEEPPRRYKLDALPSLTLKKGLTGPLTFGPGGPTAIGDLPPATFWVFLRRWPNLLRDIVVQDAELQQASREDLEPFAYGCVRTASNVPPGVLDTVTGFGSVKVTYDRAEVLVLTNRRHGSCDHYYQVARCPHCGGPLRLHVERGRVNLPQGDRGYFYESGVSTISAIEGHKPWRELQR